MPVDYAPIAARRRKPSNPGQAIADSDQMHPTRPAAMRADAGDFLERHIDQAARSQPVLLELDGFRHGKSLSNKTGALVAAQYKWNQFKVDCYSLSRQTNPSDRFPGGIRRAAPAVPRNACVK